MGQRRREPKIKKVKLKKNKKKDGGWIILNMDKLLIHRETILEKRRKNSNHI